MTALVLGPLLRHVDETSATIWVETDRACEVAVLGCLARTFEVAGHHYALVVCAGLAPGSTTAYDVGLDGVVVWPEPADPYPAPTVRTRSHDGAEPLRLLFGSCRVARPHQPPYTLATGAEGVGVDALHAYARRMLTGEQADWPDALLLVGDQVYADEVSPQTLSRIQAVRSTDEPPGEGVKDFQEYTWLYDESWGDPLVRWALSTIPSAMVFDDHDVHDDWNTSAAWRRTMQARSWWQDRIEGGLMSYWVYQHLGNLSPAALAEDELWASVQAAVGDTDPLLRAHAQRADAEADGGKGVRWSYRRDYGDVRLLVLDSRGGRVLDTGERSIVDAAEWAWIVEQTRDCASHLLLASSLPVLLPPAIHGLEAWNEAVAAGAWGRRWRGWGEKIRQGADLEHWAAFGASFDALMALVAEVGSGPRAPASITFLGGDVHFSYLAQARFPESDRVTSAVHQAVCSPVRNPVDRKIQAGDRFASTAAGRWIGRLLARTAGVTAPAVTWRVDHGPWFDNEIGAIELAGGSALFRLERAVPGDADERLEMVLEQRLV
ncbi:MAG: alkaline phosphatase D family protein [Frankiales bacterium]|nr:alkaline phosphatase D family protein [Frankiales bacterium]